MTQRTAFVLSVRPEKIEEYVRAHREVWPEMLDALRGAGIRNYTIFRDGNRMFGYNCCNRKSGSIKHYRNSYALCWSNS